MDSIISGLTMDRPVDQDAMEARAALDGRKARKAAKKAERRQEREQREKVRAVKATLRYHIHLRAERKQKEQGS